MNGCVVYFNEIIKVKLQISKTRCTRCANGECMQKGKISLKLKIVRLHDEVSPRSYFCCGVRCSSHKLSLRYFFIYITYFCINTLYIFLL